MRADEVSRKNLLRISQAILTHEEGFLGGERRRRELEVLWRVWELGQRPSEAKITEKEKKEAECSLRCGRKEMLLQEPKRRGSRERRSSIPTLSWGQSLMVGLVSFVISKEGDYKNSMSHLLSRAVTEKCISRENRENMKRNVSRKQTREGTKVNFIVVVPN